MIFDPRRPSMFDPVALAGVLGGMSAAGLSQAEDMFRMAAEGWQIRIAGGDFVEFSSGARAIPLSIAHIIADHRATGVAFLGELERLASLVGDAAAATDEIDGLEALWQLEVENVQPPMSGSRNLKPWRLRLRMRCAALVAAVFGCVRRICGGSWRPRRTRKDKPNPEG